MASLLSALQNIGPFAEAPAADYGATSKGPPIASGRGTRGRRRNMFGMIGQALRGAVAPQNLSHNLQVIGAGLNDASTGEHTLETVVQRMDAQRRQDAEDAWQRMARARQTSQWGAEDRAVASAPDNLRPFAEASPSAYVSGVMGASTRPSASWVTLTAQEARRLGLQPGTAAQMNTATGELRVAQSPYHPPASMMGDGTDGSSFTPNPAGVPAGPQVGAVEDGYRYNGGDPGDPSSWSRVR